MFEILKGRLVGVDLVDKASEREHLGASNLFIGCQVDHRLWWDTVWRRIVGWSGDGGFLVKGLELNGAIEKEKEVKRADMLILNLILNEMLHPFDPGLTNRVIYVRDFAGLQ